MKRSFHCITEETVANTEDLKKWQIRQILRSNQKTQFIFDFFGNGSANARMNYDLLDVVIAMNAYGLYRFVGLTSPEFDGFLSRGMGSLIMDRLIPTCNFDLPAEIMHHVLRLRVCIDLFYGGFGFDYVCKLITDWQSTKNLFISIFSNIEGIVDLCLWYME